MNETHEAGSFLRNDLKVTSVSTAALKEIPDKEVLPPEDSGCWELIVCHRGLLEITSREKSFTLKEGQLVFRFPGARFEIKNPGDRSAVAGVLGFSAENMPLELISEETIWIFLGRRPIRQKFLKSIYKRNIEVK